MERTLAEHNRIQASTGETRRLSFASLFSGMGGMSLGFESAGMECCVHCEPNKQCKAVLRRHWPDVPIYDRVEDIVGDELRGLDLICGGDPCQRNSAASSVWGSKQPALGGEFIRVVGVAQPTWVVRENPRRVRKDAPWPPERFAACLERMGYATAILDIQGAPLTGVLRDRTFVVGSDPARVAGLLSVLPVGEGHRWPRPQSEEEARLPVALTSRGNRINAEENHLVEETGFVRVLDRVERLRAQGFPDDWFPEGVSFTAACRMTGNTVPVPVVRKIGQAMVHCEGRQESIGR